MKRLFFAIPLPVKWKKSMHSSFPEKNFPGVRFTPEENLHITVHFLGETSEEKIPTVLQQAKEILATTSCFKMKSDALKTILEKKKPVMIWALFEENATVENLCLKFRAAFPTSENRKPNPHVTLARIKQLKQLPFELPPVNIFSFTVDQLELWESFTKPEGAEYKCIESWKLM